MAVFYTSDWHIGHANILRLSDRPFKDIDEMNMALIENHNSVVAPNDTVYVLGDVALGKIADSLPLVGLLNGIKICCSGNHDRTWSGMGEKNNQRYRPEYAKVFDHIASEYIRHSVGNHQVLLCHFPYDGDSQAIDRHVDKRPADYGIPLIHGHTHSSEKHSFSSRGTPMFHVGVDANNYYPVSEDEIITWLDTVTLSSHRHSK